MSVINLNGVAFEGLYQVMHVLIIFTQTSHSRPSLMTGAKHPAFSTNRWADKTNEIEHKLMK